MSADLLPALLEQINGDARRHADWGRVASYIPELACVDPAQFAISVCCVDGREYHAGDVGVGFSIQSVSKVFTLALALGRFGDGLWERVGKEPSGRAFNSIVQLEVEDGIPRNPFINAGAIVTTDAVLGSNAPRDTLGEILLFLREAAEDGDIHINDSVARSEYATGDRNFALAHFLRSCGNLHNSCDKVLGTYFHHCAIEMTTAQLARAARFLCGGFAGQRMIGIERVRSINALMMTCGHYDGSGAFAYRVGFPGKSGVGGGIMAVVPNVASIAVWSPGLDRYGNSQQGTAALERLSRDTGWSVFS
ncbi:glutaminase [Halomonas sp. V046]|uniref:glutaminase n=1 Tax=Halomonas sp. V046 TaxID=3459611 RepID=UPI0040451A0A